MGFTLKQFFCCGQLKSISLTNGQNTENNCRNVNQKSGCCNNKFQFFKVNDNHFTSDDIKAPVKQVIDLHLFTPSFQEIPFCNSKIIICNRSNAPPLYPGVPTYINNCVFRI